MVQEIKRKFTQRSDRVKGVELHPTEPWLLANLYSGNVYVWSTADQSLVKSFEVTELPVRTAKFVARKQWIVTGSDDMFIRVYNYNTMDKVKAFEAHTDYIRSIAVHPSLPYLLSSSDDMLIKLWDWEKGWICTQIFEGHSHYVMQVTFNPKDTNTFASASLDRTVKVWSIGQPTPNFTLEGHEKGVNAVDYFTGGDRPYLISGADDKLAKVWDYQTKACVQTLEGHGHNVSAVCFHPELPIIITGSEDGSVKIWHSTTYRLESTLNYGLERLWALAACKGSNHVGLGYDDGTVLIKIGREEPVASMDSSGKIIWARHNEIQTVNVKSLGADFEDADGERLPLAVKDLGSCDMYPGSLVHSPNGRFVAVCGDGEYIIYTALAWRNKSYGSALSFVWGEDSNVFATRDSSSSVRLHKNFKDFEQIKPGFAIEEIHGGALLGLRSQDFVCFYDWTTAQLVRRIEVPAKDIRWSGGGDLVAIIGESSFYVLRYDRDAVEQAVVSGAELDDDGIEEAFELQTETSEAVRTGLWIGDCFIYTNGAWRLNYCVGGEVTTMFHLDRPMYLLGYLAAQSKVYLIDKEFSVMGYTLLLSLIEYKTLVMRGDFDAANEILPQIPQEQRNAVARFLDARDMKAEALQIATDADYRFDLAVSLGELGVALKLAEQSGSELKWRQLGELALSAGKLQVAEECLQKAGDLSGLLLLYTAKGSGQGLGSLISAAGAQNRQNIVFLCHLLLGNLHPCVDLLIATGRLPEAAFFARTYVPSRMTEVVKLWREDLAGINAKAAESLADPAQYPNLFPNLDLALHAEQYQAQKGNKPRPAAAFALHESEGMQDLLSLMQNMSVEGGNGAELPQANGDLGEHGHHPTEGEEDVHIAPAIEDPTGGTAELEAELLHTPGPTGLPAHAAEGLAVQEDDKAKLEGGAVPAAGEPGLKEAEADEEDDDDVDLDEDWGVATGDVGDDDEDDEDLV